MNNNYGFSEFLKIIKNYRNIKIGMESTSIYHVNLYNYLIENSRSAIILNSLETKLLKSSRIRKNKTDKIDAEAIAKYIIIRKNNIITMDKNTENTYTNLKEYVYTYIRINRKITMAKNQLIVDMDLLYPGLTAVANVNSKYFMEIISNIDQIIENNYKIKYISDSKHSEIRNILINSNTNNAVKYDIDINIETLELLNKQLMKTKNIIEDEYNSMDSKIKTIPGIGTITGSIILSSIGDINRFDSIIKLRAYSGMDPVVKQSGDYNITSKISKRGNPLIRYALYLSTVSAIRFNPVIKRYYTRKKNDGMKGNKLLIACSNKLLNIIYSVLKNNKDFEDPLNNIN
ncbi:IS110 family RNA-guided transposase [Ferroplasma acidiphilum]|uniref:IS110 family transposase n=1 Tax=Ferroplasma acidiphilum TaxID=74969 RepID=UPI0021501E47|nr:IS110 family transposase [Ferroplasma acidiphilum]